jgi:adenylosuccinate lyase
MGYTHLQPAEPTTLGYRLSTYAQDLMLHFDLLARLRLELRGKGVKGSVGTYAPFTEMLEDSPVSAETLEATVMHSLGLDSFPITGQTYPRVQDYLLLSALGGLACSLHKFAFDLRLLQSPGFSTVREPFGEGQVGSSAMPFKRNPIKAEKICSLARLVAAGVDVAWQNAAVSLLERTLDDSANRRSLIPEAFLACDEMLRTAIEVVQGLDVDRESSAGWIKVYGPFAATERILTALVQAGADRQAMHERLRQHSLQAWEGLRQAGVNTLADRVAGDTTILRYLQPSRVRELMDISTYTGLASARSHEFAAQIRERFQDPPQAP